MECRRIVPALLLAGLLAGAASARAEIVWVPTAPDVVGPGGEGRFVPLRLTHLNGDADFPMLLVGKVDAGFPQFAVLVVDARNGKDTWSLRGEPVVFYLLFSDGTGDQQIFLDEGFAERGQASGTFLAGGPDEVEHLLARLGASYSRCRSWAALREI
jgi:hypothetical protein